MHNKEYALKLVQDKINGLNNYSYSQIANLTGYKKLQIIRFSKQLNEKDIDSILVHGLTKVVRVKYYNIFYETKQIEGHFQDPVKREQIRIDNQKQLEQVKRTR